MEMAEDLCRQALDIDPDCDVAIATLAQLSLQQGKIAEAIEWFEKSAKLARTEVELSTAITCESPGIVPCRQTPTNPRFVHYRRTRLESSTGVLAELPSDG
jgi:import receptor subunit TOM70